jgi:Na+/H+ antiporter NhaC
LGLLPFVLALFFLLKYRDNIFPLIGALVIGAIFISRFNPLLGIFHSAGETIFETLSDTNTVLILLIVVEVLVLFTWISRRGYLGSFVQWTTGGKLPPKKLESIVLSSAAVVFIDRHLCATLAGLFTRPFAERHALSPPRHGYFINTAASSVAGLVPLTTLTPVTVAAIGVSFQNLGIQFSPVQALIYSIPYQFFSIFSLFIAFTLVVLQKEPFPMAQGPGDVPMVFGQHAAAAKRGRGREPGFYRYLVPAALAVLFASMVLGLLFVERWTDRFGDVRTMRVVFVNALFAALVFTILFTLVTRTSTYGQINAEANQWSGAPLTLVFYLILALAMANMAGKLQIQEPLTRFWPDNPMLVPLVVFSVSSVFGFLSGSAPLTIAVILPIALQVTSVRLTDPLLVNQYIFAAIAAVQSGAVFGDMNSPLSPTFILSSASSGSSVYAHLKTQLPYSLGAFLISCVFGYVLLMLNVTPYLSIAVGFLVIAGMVFMWGGLGGKGWLPGRTGRRPGTSDTQPRQPDAEQVAGGDETDKEPSAHKGDEKPEAGGETDTITGDPGGGSAAPDSAPPGREDRETRGGDSAS